MDAKPEVAGLGAHGNEPSRSAVTVLLDPDNQQRPDGVGLVGDVESALLRAPFRCLPWLKLELVAMSPMRELMPWLYDLALELYRHSTAGNERAVRRVARDLREATEFSLHGPGRHLYRRDKRSMMLMEYVEEMSFRVMHAMERIAVEPDSDGDGGESVGRVAKRSASDD